MKNLTKKTLLSTSILSAFLLATVSGVAVANTNTASKTLTAAETKEVIQDLKEDMLADGIKVSFPNALPSMTFNPSTSLAAETSLKNISDKDIAAIDAEMNNASLAQQDKHVLLDSIIKQLAAEGARIDFGGKLPQIERLDPKVDALDADIQANGSEVSLKNIANEMINSGNAENAAKVYEKYHGGGFSGSVSAGSTSNALDVSESQYVLDVLQHELAMSGYKANLSGVNPQVTIDQSKWLKADNSPLTADAKRDIIADMQDRLADAGISANLSKYQPSIERVAITDPDAAAAELNLNDAEFTRLAAEYKAELNKMATQVINSGDLDKAVDIIADYETAHIDVAELKLIEKEVAELDSSM